MGPPPSLPPQAVTAAAFSTRAASMRSCFLNGWGVFMASPGRYRAGSERQPALFGELRRRRAEGWKNRTDIRDRFRDRFQGPVSGTGARASARTDRPGVFLCLFPPGAAAIGREVIAPEEGFVVERGACGVTAGRLQARTQDESRRADDAAGGPQEEGGRGQDSLLPAQQTERSPSSHHRPRRSTDFRSPDRRAAQGAEM